MRPLLLVAALQAVAVDAGAANALAAPAQAGAVTVAGLDGSDREASRALTEGLRRSMLARGFVPGAEASLSNLRLAGGCAENGAECLARGAVIVGAQQIVFGALEPSESGFSLEVSVLDVASAELVVQSYIPLSAADLSADQIDHTAQRVLGVMFPDDAPTAPTLEAAEVAEAYNLPSDRAATTTPSEPDSEWIWGPYNPRPIGKRVFLGVSVGVASFGLVGVVGAALGRRSAGNRIIEAAERSSTDGVGDGRAPDVPNDVAVGSRESMCTTALQQNFDSQNPTAVYNSEVAKACASRTTAGRYLVGMAVVGGIGLLATAVSTTLMFVRRSDAKRRASVGISPSVAGVSVHGRF